MGIFRGTRQLFALAAAEGLLKGIGGQLGGAATAGHGVAGGIAGLIDHGCTGSETGHKCSVEPSFPTPKPGIGAEAGVAPKQPRLSAGADGEPEELEGSALRPPGLRRLPTADLFKIAGQWLGGTHGPDAGGGAFHALNHRAVPAGDHLGVVKGLQGGTGQHSAVLVASQSALGEPAGGFTTRAQQRVGGIGGRGVAELDVCL